MATEETKQIITHELPVKIELTKGAKGEYRWTVTTHARNVEEAVAEVAKANILLRAEYEKEAA